MAENGSELISAIHHVCDEKNISFDSVITTIEAALAAAYRKDFGEKNQNVVVEFDAENGGSKVYDVKTVVEDVDLEELEKQLEEQKERKEAGEEIPEEEEIKRFNAKTDIMISEAKKIKKTVKLGDEIKTRLSVPSSYGRMAAQTAKQVIIQRLREAEREKVFNEFKDKEGEVLNAIIQRHEGPSILLDIGQATAIMPPDQQVRRERYESGRRFKVILVSVEMSPKGPQIIVSRSSADLVAQLFAHEVPEINSGMVEIKAIAREAGDRTKVAVHTEEENIDPVGSCVGQRGTRVQTIIQELNGEKIDIVEWSEDIHAFIESAISPAKIINSELNEEDKTAVVKVKEDQLSLAIGRGGQNVRLASKLVGYQIDIAREDGTIQRLEKKAAAEKKAEESGEEKTDEAAEEKKDETPTENTPEEKPKDSESDKSSESAETAAEENNK